MPIMGQMETNKQKKATSKEKMPNVSAKGLSFFFSPKAVW